MPFRLINILTLAYLQADFYLLSLRLVVEGRDDQELDLTKGPEEIKKTVCSGVIYIYMFPSSWYITLQYRDESNKQLIIYFS